MFYMKEMNEVEFSRNSRPNNNGHGGLLFFALGMGLNRLAIVEP